MPLSDTNQTRVSINIIFVKNLSAGQTLSNTNPLYIHLYLRGQKLPIILDNIQEAVATSCLDRNIADLDVKPLKNNKPNPRASGQDQ